MDDDRACRICRLNDALRCGGLGGSIHITSGITGLGDAGVLEVLSAVAGFGAFNSDNDPWGEHDCATLTVAGRTILFKIDYYDLALSGGSEDPDDPHVTRRVLTVILAEEY